MTVVAVEPGRAHCRWRGEERRVDTVLVGDCAVGDRLLVFLDSARERLDEARAAEIDATLALVAQAQAGLLDAAGGAAAAFDAFPLPSALDAADLAAFAGRPAAVRGPAGASPMPAPIPAPIPSRSPE
ncbi:hydrogenase maturation protein HupF/HypC/HoxL [Piscinibacter sakaiensis]|uniref:Hydrogenase maturation protein HupF/HypC/HoxL n=2 Tax=Piscinibacter sakaiensis TaxID=1547922 RepID=A0A0K8P8I5_PISS1|nr:hydrogenase maturation protein HupF/HypC/HoxL [Piscinibacter sakaiensis]